MNLKLGDKVRYNEDGLKICDHSNFNYYEYYGEVIKIESIFSDDTKNLITFKTDEEKEVKVKDIYLEKGAFDYDYQCKLFNEYFKLNISKKDILDSEIYKYTSKIIEEIKSVNIDFDDLNYYNYLYEQMNSLNFSPNTKKDYKKVLDKVNNTAIYFTPRFYQLFIYLINHRQLYFLLKNIIESSIYKEIDKFTSSIAIEDKDKFFEYRFSGINNGQKVKVKKIIAKEDLK